MKHALVRLVGWVATIFHGDPTVFDRWRWLRRHLLRGPVRTLDAGCGSGAFTIYAARVGKEAVGISFDEANNRKARERANILGVRGVEFIDADLGDLGSMADQLGEFDQIICLETIEHIANDRKLAADLARLLKPGGRLLLTTPYKHFRRLFGDKLSEREDGGHVRWGYTHKEMRKLLEGVGLIVVAEEYVSGFVSQRLACMIRILSRANHVIAWVVTLPFRILQVLDPTLTSFIKYPHVSIAVVACRAPSRKRSGGKSAVGSQAEADLRGA